MQAFAGNVNHNTKTMGGKNTSNGMGIIVAVTPSLKSTTIIPRLADIPSADLLKLAQIESQMLLRSQRPKAIFIALPQLLLHDMCYRP